MDKRGCCSHMMQADQIAFQNAVQHAVEHQSIHVGAKKLPA